MKLNWVEKDIQAKLKDATLTKSSSNDMKQIVYKNMLIDIGILNSDKKNMIDKYSFFKAFDYLDITSFDTPIFKLISYIASNISNIDTDFTYSDSLVKEQEYVIKVCQDFYKRYNKESLRYLKEILSKKNCIHFLNSDDRAFFGRSYILSSSEYYMLINGNNYLQNCLTCIHEFKHIEYKLKGYDLGIALYKELPSILYEFYMLDYLLLVHNNPDDIQFLRACNINKYLKMIKKLNEQVEFIKKLNDEVFYSNIYENYEVYYDLYDLQSIYNIMKNGCADIIGYIISFIVSIDIYRNNEISSIGNIISCYNFGYYNMKPKIVNNVLEYIRTIIDNIDKDRKKKKKQKKY